MASFFVTRRSRHEKLPLGVEIIIILLLLLLLLLIIITWVMVRPFKTVVTLKIIHQIE